MAQQSGVDMKSMNRVLKRLETETLKIKNKTNRGMIAAMLDVLRRAKKNTPVVHGNLRSSGFLIWNGKTQTGFNPSFKDKKGGKKSKVSSSLSSSRMASDHSSFVADTKNEAGTSSKWDIMRGAVGFSAAYALKTHENPRSGKTGGVSPSGYQYKKGTWSKVGFWKFLENPLKRTNRFLSILAKFSKVK